MLEPRAEYFRLQLEEDEPASQPQSVKQPKILTLRLTFEAANPCLRYCVNVDPQLPPSLLAEQCEIEIHLGETEGTIVFNCPLCGNERIHRIYRGSEDWEWASRRVDPRFYRAA